MDSNWITIDGSLQNQTTSSSIAPQPGSEAKVYCEMPPMCSPQKKAAVELPRWRLVHGWLKGPQEATHTNSQLQNARLHGVLYGSHTCDYIAQLHCHAHMLWLMTSQKKCYVTKMAENYSFHPKRLSLSHLLWIKPVNWCTILHVRT